MIKNIATLAFQQYKQPFYNIKLIHLFSSQDPTQSKVRLNYPYRFGGGSMQGQFKHNNKVHYFLKNTFQDNLFDGFKEAYRSIVHSIAENDVNTLKDIFEPNLLRHYKSKQVQLLNPDADIEIVCGKGLLLCEGTFLRGKNNYFAYAFDQSSAKMIRYIKPSFITENLLLDIYVKVDSKSSFLALVTKDIPVLFSFEMFFKSKMKIIPQNFPPEAQLNTQEIHSVQFEVETKFNISQLLKKAFASERSKNENPKEVFLQILGKNYEWKVGDIDRMLNGNFFLIS